MEYVLFRWLAEKTGEIVVNVEEFIGKRENTHTHDQRYLNMLIN